jgi:hypothetical protein
VPNGERRDRLQKAPRSAHQEYQREDEHQVIDAQQDVLDAEAEVCHGSHRRAVAGHGELRSPGLEKFGDRATIGELYADEDVRHRRLESGDDDRLSTQSAFTHERHTVQERVRQGLSDTLALGSAGIRERRVDHQPQIAARGLFPRHAIAVGGRLLDVEVARPQLVGTGGSSQQGHEHEYRPGRPRGAQDPAAHHFAASNGGCCQVPSSASGFGQ